MRQRTLWLAVCGAAFASAALGQQLTPRTDRIDSLASDIPSVERPSGSSLPTGAVPTPASLDQSFEEAANAAQRGDYAHAAESYRHMLLADPTLDRVRLDLGLAYARLGKYDQAKNEFGTVLAHDIPDRVRQNIESVLKQIEKAQKRNDFNGSVAFGTLFDSDGNSAPNNDKVLVRDTIFTLDRDNRARSDFQQFATATLAHTYHASSMPLDWHSSGTYYQTEQDRIHSLDLRIASLSTGPTWRLGDSGQSVDALFGYTDVTLHGHRYLALPSLEIGTERDIGSTWHGRLSLREEYRNFVNAPNVTVYDQRTGAAHQLRFALLHALGPQDTIDTAFTLRREEAKEDYFANWQWSPEIGFTHRWDEGWFARAEASYRDSAYDEPDRIISARTRRDLEGVLGVSLGKTFANNVSLTAAYEYRNVDSSIANYNYDNNRFTLTAGWQF